ncbi:MAG: hypothetical protein N3D73_02355 [Candidatus Diapherotrites archaeon]|nr:hypothetical protein [Candidatus Diapherotrites archaeon]
MITTIARTISGILENIKKYLKIGRYNTQELQKRKELLESEIKLAETKFMKREISEEAYKKIVGEKSKELITLETEIEINKIENRLNKYADDIDKLSEKRRGELKSLLSKKDILLRELAKAKELYFKRKIDENMYKEFCKDKQQKLVEIEAAINQLYKEEARDILKEAERRISMSEIQEFQLKTEEIAKDIAELPEPLPTTEEKVLRRKRRHGRRVNN